MSGIKPFDFGEGASDDGDIVSHDSAGNIEDTTGMLEMLMSGGPPKVKTGLPDVDSNTVVRPEDMASIIVKVERIAGESGSFFGFIQEIVQPMITKALSSLTGYVPQITYDGLVERVRKLEMIKGKATDTDGIALLRAELEAERAERIKMAERLDQLERDFSEFSAGAREIYNAFDSDRSVQVDPKIAQLLARAEAAEKARDDLLKKGNTGGGSGGTQTQPTAISSSNRRHDRSPATNPAVFRTRFTPPLTMAEAARRFNAGER